MHIVDKSCNLLNCLSFNWDKRHDNRFRLDFEPIYYPIFDCVCMAVEFNVVFVFLLGRILNPSPDGSVNQRQSRFC